MKILFILDPLEYLKSEKDTSLAIMREAARRGHTLFVSMQYDIFLRDEGLEYSPKSLCLLLMVLT